MTGYGVRGTAVLAQTVLAATLGALIYALWTMPSAPIAAEFLLWLAIVAGTTIPIAFAGVGLVGLLSISGWRRAPMLIPACLAGVVASIYFFEFYMTKLSPAHNWSRAAILPVSCFISGFSLALFQWPRFDARKKGVAAESE